MRLLKWMSLMAASAVLLVSGTAAAQDFPLGLFERNGDPQRVCGEGIDEGDRCNEEISCDLFDPGDELGLCSELVILEFMPGLDNPDVYPLNNRFFDRTNLTTMYAWFDLEGYNFAAGRARRTEDLGTDDLVRADFQWVIGVPTRVRQKEKRNRVDQNSFVAILLAFSSIVPGVNPEDPDIITPLFSIADPDNALLPVEIEGCAAKVTVREPTKAKNITEVVDGELIRDFSDIELDATWRLDCKDLPMPEGLACIDGTDTCPPEEQVTSQDLLEFFEGKKDSVKARGKEDVDYCDSFIAGPERPESCD